MPTPVSTTVNSSTASARDSASLANWRPSARPIRSLTPPESVNLNAFERRFLITCCIRCSSVSIVGGTFAPCTSISKSRLLSSATGLGELDLAVLDRAAAVLLFEELRLLVELLVRLLQLLLLRLQQLFRGLEGGGLLLELLVRLLELLLLRLQLFGLALQLLRQSLRLREQLLGPHVRLDRVQHHADRLGELLEECLLDVGEALERGELDHRQHL